jgi:hypothetical protein
MSIFFSSGGDDFDEQIGLPNQQSGGLILANKWGNTSTNNTGQYQRLQSDAKGTSYTKTILSNSILNNNTTNDQVLDKRKYRFNTINEWGTDSTGLFKIIFKAANTLKDANADYSGLTTNEFGTKINQTERQTSLSEDDKLIVSNLSYRKKFAKKGRTISLVSDLNFNDKAQDATLISENSLFDAANSETDFIKSWPRYRIFANAHLYHVLKTYATQTIAIFAVLTRFLSYTHFQKFKFQFFKFSNFKLLSPVSRFNLA